MLNRNLFQICSVFLALLIGSTTCYSMSGRELFGYCKSSFEAQKSMAIGYVTSVADNNLLNMNSTKNNICIPSSTSRTQLFNTVCDYISNNPKTVDELGVYVVRKAFQKYFSCTLSDNKVG